ncbi:MAG: hypothetical protein ABR528_14225 [Pseudonocardiaceae bacterium]
MADPAGALVIDAGCGVAAGALVAAPVPVLATVGGAGWLAEAAGVATAGLGAAWPLAQVGVPVVVVGAAWVAAVFDPTVAVLEAPGDCGARCPVTG